MAKKETPKTPDAIVPYDYSGDAGAGMENVKSDDLSIPFLMLLQDLSPEVKKTHKDHLTKGIPGAQPGHMINSLSRKILNPDVAFDKVRFVPCSYQKLYVEWTPRDQGGGIIASHADSSILNKTTKNDRGQDILPNKNIVVTTAYFFGFVIEGEEYTRVVLSMTSTQLKKARAWLSIATSIKFDGPNGKFNPPLFSHYYNLSAIPESNDQGSWYGWKVEMGGRIDDPVLINQAREVVAQIKSGQARLAASATTESDEDI
jgi:hypothetical protein